MNDYDVLVIGAGPAGSTAAYHLANKGFKVLVIEKEKLPRYHVGESLMPYCYFPLERMGLSDWMRESAYPKKQSVQFVRSNGQVSQPFYFFQHFDHKAATTWQVDRAEFDKKLMDNAQSKGAELLQGTKVTDLIEENAVICGVVTDSMQDDHKRIRSKIVIDASGKNAFSINRFNSRIPDKLLKKISIWTYYKGAKRDPGLDEGATTVAYLPKKAWFWYIPLSDDRVSVGLVADPSYLNFSKADYQELFEREIQKNEWIKDHLSIGELCDKFYVTSDFSYRSDFVAKEGLVLAGDAFSFLDPVFSSGVFLALRSGEMVATAVAQALKNNNLEPDQFLDYQKEFVAGLESMKKLVYAFYDTNFSFGKLMRKYPNLKGDLTDCLIGNLEVDFKPLFSAVAEFTNG